MLAEHWGLAILFALILTGCIAYGWRLLHAPARRPPSQRAAPAASPAQAPSAAQPIYIEALPDKQQP
jgi:hypothetical protein